MSGLWDAPNQQVVREDGSAPWQEGTGGSAEVEAGPSMTKAELLDRARELGVESPTTMTKAELQAAVDRAEAEQAATG